MKRIFVSMAFAWLCVYANAQFSLSGNITDEKGEKLAGANIIIDGTLKGIIADSNGHFNFNNLKAGNYRIVISFIGYEPIEKEIELNKDVDLSLTLTSSAFLSEEVIIQSTSAMNHDPITYTNIKGSEINKSNLGQDLPMLLSMSTSAVVTSDAGAGVGYTGIRIRGNDASRTNVTINGIPVNDAESHGVYWVDIPDFAENVDNIQIQRGIGSSSNGAGDFGSSMKIQTTRFNANPYAEIKSTAGSFNTFKNTVGVGTGLIASHYTFDGRLSVISSNGYTDRASSDLHSYFATGGYFSEKNIIKINFFGGKEKTYQAWNGIPKAKLNYDTAGMKAFYNNEIMYHEIEGSKEDSINLFGKTNNRTYNVYRYKNQTDNYWQNYGQLLFTRKISTGLSINSVLHLTHGEGYYEQFKANDSYANYNLDNPIINGDTLTTTNIVRRLWLNNNFYGGTLSANYQTTNTNISIGLAANQYDGNHYGRVMQTITDSANRNFEWYHGKGNKTDISGYGKINYTIIPEVSIYTDLQIRYINYKISGSDKNFRVLDFHPTYNFFNPKGGITYSLSEQQNIYFIAGIANKEPTRANFVDNKPGNANPTFEKMYDFELGYKFKTMDYMLNMNLYFMDYKDQLVLTGDLNDVGDAMMLNVPKSYRRGLEIEGLIKLNPFIKLESNLTLSQNKILNYESYLGQFEDDGSITKVLEKKFDETEIAFSPSLISSTTLTVSPIKNFECKWLSKYVGKQYIDNTQNNDRSLAAYWINNLDFSYATSLKYFKNISAHLLINNVLNKEYISNAWIYRYMYAGEVYSSDGYFPQATRNYMVGLTLKF